MNPANPPRWEQDPQAVTVALDRLVRGQTVAEDLASLLYADLRRLANALMQRERKGHTLQATGLVHEAWVRLVDATRFQGDTVEVARRRFLGIAVETMRRILVEHARGRAREKRGGGCVRVTMPTEVGADSAADEHGELLDLDAALTWLAERKPRLARLAELRIYGGLSVAEAADVLEVALATAKSDWVLAQALLTQRVREP